MKSLCAVFKVHISMREWLSGGVSPCQGEGRGFKKETPDFYHREGTMVLKPNEEWSCSYWIEVL